MCAVALLQCSRLWFGRSPKRCCFALIKRLSKFELRNNRNSQLLWVFVPCCHCIRAFVASTNQRKGTNSVKRAAVAARALCRTQSNVLAETTPFPTTDSMATSYPRALIVTSRNQSGAALIPPYLPILALQDTLTYHSWCARAKKQVIENQKKTGAFN